MVNERLIKISSPIPTVKKLKLGQDVEMTIAGQEITLNCVKIEQKDNQDGTVDEVYVLKYFG